jgi:hypothetical protein
LSIPETYLADHLFLLVGTNPLPNYVSARVLCRPDAHLYLVTSRKMEQIRNNLVAALGLEIGRNCTVIEINESDGSDIFNGVSKAAKALEGKGRVMLNYTGGTKVMAVHAYRALETTLTEGLFSYLDARSLKMVIQKPGGLGESYTIEYKVELETLLGLHNYEYYKANINGQTSVKQPNQQPLLAQQAGAFARALWKAWEEGDSVKERFELFKKFYEAWNNWKNGVKGKLKTDHALLPLPADVENISLADLWGNNNNLAELEQDWQLDTLRILRWLDGEWLEHYTLDCAQRAGQQTGVDFIGQGIKIQKKATKNATPVDVELDILAIKGHQLFAISCMSNPKKSTLKDHLLEIFMRARQLGGDEARIALVCIIPPFTDINGSFIPGPEVLQEEVGVDWMAEDVIQIYGLEQLQNLEDYLKKWFEKR